MRMVYVMFAAIVAAAVIGGARSLASSPERPAPNTALRPVANDSRADPGDPASTDEGAHIEGALLEVIDVPK
jgi:hypothetical protein